jgi:DnaJ-class molecular chaperone
MKTKKEYVKDLELDPNKDWTVDEIKKQYRKLSFLYHEDKTGDSKKHKNIIEAYEALKNNKYVILKTKESDTVSSNVLHDALFSMMKQSGKNIFLKNSDFNVVKIDNMFVNIDSSKLSKDKIVKIGNNFYKLIKK